MGIDISALMQDPQMQFGLGLLGAGRSMNPVADAATMMQGLQNAQNQHQLQLQQIERMKQQTVNEKQSQALGLLGYLQTAGLIQKAGNIGPNGEPIVPENQLPPVAGNLPPYLAQLLPEQATGLTGQVQQNMAPAPTGMPDQGGGAVPQSVMPPQIQMGQPPVQTGQYGTPTTLLNNLVQNESSGNPHAVGPTVPGQGNALGLYQFMPKTVQMLKAQGIDFNPLVPDQRLHNAADFYFQQLLKQNGGDITKALNAWQGANKTVGSNANLQYNARALNGVQLPAAVPTGLPQTGNSATPITGLPSNTRALAEAHRAGILGLAMGDKGAAMTKYAEMLKPQAVMSGSTVLGNNGQAAQTPMTPLQQQELSNQTPGANGLTPAATTQAVLARLQNAEATVKSSKELVQDLPQTLDALQNAKAALPGASVYMGPKADTRLALAQGLNVVLKAAGLAPTATPEAITDANVFKSQISQPLLSSIHATGGRFGPTEQALMEKLGSSLETDPKAAGQIIDFITARYTNTLNRHNADAKQFNTMSGNLPHFDYTVKPNAYAPAIGGAAPMQLNDYLNKYRK